MSGTLPHRIFRANAEAQLSHASGGTMKLSVTISINGRPRTHEVEPRLLLVEFLREVAGLTGTKIGCDTSQCGSCTVLLDDVAVKSCTCLAVQADGAKVTTIEGLANGGELERVQNAFW